MAVLTLLAGCGLRLATPRPTDPPPSTEETLRRTAVTDALAVRDQARAAAATQTDPRVVATLEEIAAFAAQHATQLGGPYDSGLGESATTTPTQTATPSPSTETVIGALVEATTQAQQAADTTDDGEMARLFASIGASDTVSARRLAGLTGSKSAGTSSAAPVPSAAPRGLSERELSAIVAAEDEAGYAGEVRAALLDGDARSAGYARAEIHRSRADAWAGAAGIADGADDPRRIAYALPDDVASAAFAQRLEASLASDYAALVGHAASGSRIHLARLLSDTAVAAVSFGAGPVAFPGMADLASGTATPSASAGTSPSATPPPAEPAASSPAITTKD